MVFGALYLLDKLVHFSSLGLPWVMNKDNFLLYTAVTRARSCVTLVGSAGTFQAMVDNGTEQKRYTGLCEAVKSYLSSQMSDL